MLVFTSTEKERAHQPSHRILLRAVDIGDVDVGAIKNRRELFLQKMVTMIPLAQSIFPIHLVDDEAHDKDDWKHHSE